MKVSKWGNSLAIRLTTEMVARLAVKEGDDVEIRLNAEKNGFTLRRKRSKEELRARVRALRGSMPPGFKFNRDDINEG